MATIELSINAGLNDVHESEDTVNYLTANTMLRVVASPSAATRMGTGLRFTPVAIPRGSTITAATLQLYVTATAYDDPLTHIYGHNVDNSPIFPTTAGTNDVYARRTALTTAVLALDATNIGVGWHSLNVAAIIAEIIARPGWSSGNALTLLLYGDVSATARELRFYAYEYATNVPKLSITFTPPVVSVPLFMSSYRRRRV